MTDGKGGGIDSDHMVNKLEHLSNTEEIKMANILMMSN